MARSVEFNECEIIEKAMNVFWEKGYHATSMQDLVDAMQINRSSLYNTIGDKHCLFMKCVSSYAEAGMEETRQKVAKEKSCCSHPAEYSTGFWQAHFINLRHHLAGDHGTLSSGCGGGMDSGSCTPHCS